MSVAIVTSSNTAIAIVADFREKFKTMLCRDSKDFKAVEAIQEGTRITATLYSTTNKAFIELYSDKCNFLSFLKENYTDIEVLQVEQHIAKQKQYLLRHEEYQAIQSKKYYAKHEKEMAAYRKKHGI